MSRLALLKAQIQEMVRGIPAIFGVAIKYLESGEEVLLNNHRTYILASVFKVPVLITAFRQIDAGRFSLDDRMELKKAHKTGGTLGYMRVGLQPTVEDLLMLMIIISDNTATEMVMDLVGGPQVVSATMRELGFSQNDISITMTPKELWKDVLGWSEPWLTRATLTSRLKESGINYEGEVFREGSTANVATPQAINHLYEMLLRGQVASRESCDRALEILLHQALSFRLRSHLPPEIRVAHKGGSLIGVRNDSGIIYVSDDVHVAVTVLSQRYGKPSVEWVLGAGSEEKAAIDKAIGQIARLAFEYGLG